MTHPSHHRDLPLPRSRAGRGWPEWREIRVPLEVVTPILGGSYKTREVDEVEIIRPASVRGHLRFWWRALYGAHHGSRAPRSASQTQPHPQLRPQKRLPRQRRHRSLLRLAQEASRSTFESGPLGRKLPPSSRATSGPSTTPSGSIPRSDTRAPSTSSAVWLNINSSQRSESVYRSWGNSTFLQEDEKLIMYYDNARTRLGGE